MDIKAKYGQNMENMGIMSKYGKIWKIWILKTILETLKQAKNMFFVHFTVIGIQEKNMDFHIIGTTNYYNSICPFLIKYNCVLSLF